MQKEVFENGVQQLTTFLPVNMKTLFGQEEEGPLRHEALREVRFSITIN